METKANYVVTGLFTVLVILGFGAVYAVLGSGAGGAQMRSLEVVLAGSVTGLAEGNDVLFNGIRVGRVTDLRIDPDDPSVVIATTAVEAGVPISPSTRATLAFTGLTGSAHIEFEGGSADERTVFQITEESGATPRMVADPNALTDIIATAQDVFKRVDTVMGEVELFFSDARGPLTRTLENTEKVSLALSENSAQIDTFLASIGSLGTTLATVSDDLESVLQSVDGLVGAVDPARVETIVARVEAFSGNLEGISADVRQISQSAQTSVAAFEGTGEKINSSVEKLSEVIDAVDVQAVGVAVADISEASRSARIATQDIAAITRGIDPDRIARVVENTEAATGKLDSVLSDVEGLTTTAQGALEGYAGTGDKVAAALDQFNDLMQALPADTIDVAVGDIAAATKAARAAAEDVSRLTGSLDGREEDIDTIFANVTEMAQRLNAASVRVDGVLAKMDGFLGEGEGADLFGDVSATLASFRQVADTLNTRLDSITEGLERFSGRGLRDVEALVSDTRRSISRIESAISGLERDPQRLIFGGQEGVKRFDGRQRR